MLKQVSCRRMYGFYFLNSNFNKLKGSILCQPVSGMNSEPASRNVFNFLSTVPDPDRIDWLFDTKLQWQRLKKKKIPPYKIPKIASNKQYPSRIPYIKCSILKKKSKARVSVRLHQGFIFSPAVMVTKIIISPKNKKF